MEQAASQIQDSRDLLDSVGFDARMKSVGLSKGHGCMSRLNRDSSCVGVEMATPDRAIALRCTRPSRVRAKTFEKSLGGFGQRPNRIDMLRFSISRPGHFSSQLAGIGVGRLGAGLLEVCHRMGVRYCMGEGWRGMDQVICCERLNCRCGGLR